jgi:nicotinate phosphoribosyltransferase
MMHDHNVRNNTDVYFTKTRNAIQTENLMDEATYGVFLRHESICAINEAIDFIESVAQNTIIDRYFEEGSLVPSETPLFSYTGQILDLVELETHILQKVGFACISAYNAYKMSLACRNVPFIDMHARHATGPEMVSLCAYGASVGSRSAKMVGAKGFIGSSVGRTSHLYGSMAPIGTTPHVLIGYAGSTLNSVKKFIDGNPDDKFVVALVDYYGREYTDSLEVLDWFNKTQKNTGRSLGVRLDTHGGRFAEGLDYDESVRIVSNWLHVDGKWEIVRSVMGENAFDIADDNVRDKVAKILFGTGVSVANIVHMRNILNNAIGGGQVNIVASSGFDLSKCKIMGRARAPIDYIGTGSFLPATLNETYATCDCVAINGKPSVKVGREWLRNYIMSRKISKSVGVNKI